MCQNTHGLNCLSCFGQKEANNWVFGDYAGLNFHTGHPVEAESAMAQPEGCAIISDKVTGKLLFYTNGVNIWNRNHKVMPHGKNLYGNLSSTQSALIIPYPSNPYLFYVFTINSPINEDSPPGLTYSIVDMSLDNGLGDVVSGTKNSRLLSLSGEKLTAVPHANGIDYWVITHGWDNNEFYVFLVTENGIGNPKIFKIGTTHLGANSGNAIGYLKPSPNGKKIACAVFSYEPVPFEIFTFNDITGEISNPVSLGDFPLQYGVSFSPDNSKLYLSGVSLIQFDLALPTLGQIIDSQTVVIPYGYGSGEGRLKAVQLGPDGRLYSPGGNNSTGNSTTLNILNFPNYAGDSSGLSVEKFDFGGGAINLGLPNFIESTFNGIKNEDPERCNPEASILIFPNPTSKFVYIEADESCFNIRSIKVLNYLGEILTAEFFEEFTSKWSIDIGMLPAGVYLIEINVGNDKFYKKVIKFWN